MIQNTINFRAVLQTAGFRATKRRVHLLETLARASKPLSVEDMRLILMGSMNGVTIYRALEAFLKCGIVRRVDLEHRHAHYELALGKEHHHHIVCNGCGIVEDIGECSGERLQKRAVEDSKRFKKINSHNLEFFGLCVRCA